MRQSLRSLLGAVAILGAVSSLALVARADEESARGLKIGEILSPRAVAGLDGRELKFPSADGLTVVVFWATWSPRSEPLLKFWVKTQEGYSSRQHPFSIIALNADHQEMDAEKMDVVRKYVEEKGITIPVAVDKNLDTYNLIGVKSLPTTYYFKADGSLAYEEPGFPTSASIDMAEELDRELGIVLPPTGESKEVVAAYVPKNRALLYFNMGLNLKKIGMPMKARGKFLEALVRDPDYPDPLKALEDDFFKDGRTPEAVEKLREFLTTGNLPALAEGIK